MLEEGLKQRDNTLVGNYVSLKAVVKVAVGVHESHVVLLAQQTLAHRFEASATV
jgi:hypothetical protein